MSICGKNVDTLQVCKQSNRDFFPPIYRKYLYSLFSSLPLYYAGSPKVPPLGPKPLRGQQAYLALPSPLGVLGSIFAGYGLLVCGLSKPLAHYSSFCGQFCKSQLSPNGDPFMYDVDQSLVMLYEKYITIPANSHALSMSLTPVDLKL